jgi:hypothetical protein
MLDDSDYATLVASAERKAAEAEGGAATAEGKEAPLDKLLNDMQDKYDTVQDMKAAAPMIKHAKQLPELFERPGLMPVPRVHPL